jgi:hypothetical protein
MRLLIALAAGTFLASSACAQALFEDATETHLPARTGAHNSMDVEAADLDGDGDLDLVIPQEFRLNRVLLNDGRGRFTDISDRLPPLTADEVKAPPPLPGHDSEDVSIADFNGDGRLDFVIVSEDDVRFGRTPVHEYYRGLGGARYERVLGQVPDTEANAVAHADLNGDRRPDLLIVGYGQDRLLINDGRGGFRDETDTRLPREAALGQDAEFIDVDGDRDLDVVLGIEGGHAVWINDGRGRFTDETAARLPAVAGMVEARKVTPADIDRDGDLDLYFSHVGWQGRAPQDRLYLNDGRGRFTDGTTGRIPEEALTTADAKFADLDADGDLDLVQVNLGPLKLFENDGRGRFTDATARWLPAAVDGPGLAVEIADLNGDRKPDLYVGMLGGPQQNPQAYDRLLLHR